MGDLLDSEDKNSITVSGDELPYGNPLAEMPLERVKTNAAEFAKDHGLDENLLVKAALLIKFVDPREVENITESEIRLLKQESKSPLKTQRWTLYFAILLNSIAAAIQGWDQTGTNGANLAWPEKLGINLNDCIRDKKGGLRAGTLTASILDATNPNTTIAQTNAVPGVISPPNCGGALWKIGFVNATPYIIITIIGWWLSDPLNHYLGRRKTIFIAAIFSLLAPIGSGFVQGWGELIVCRALLGIGMGLKEVTVPIYTAEIAPAASRGKLVMSWQIWTTVGIFFGAAANLVSNALPVKGRIWRYELGSAFIPAVPILLGVFFCPESPRWLYKQGRINEETGAEGRINKAFHAFARLRKHKLQAARDLYYIHIHWNHGNHEAPSVLDSLKRFQDLFRRPGCRRAMIAASILMASQQLCGINVFAFYSSTVYDTNTTDPNLENNPFSHAGRFQRLRVHRALSFTMGYAAVQFAVGLLAIPAIDRFGRRFLLLLTIPAMSLFLLIAGQSFRLSNSPLPIRQDTTLAFILLFAAAYAPGMGPIPFTYSAEVFPLTHREIGMGWAVAVNNFWASLLALTFPKIFKKFHPDGALGFFSGLSVLAFILIFVFVPETKRMTLEYLVHFFEYARLTREYLEYNLFTLGLYYYRKIFGMTKDEEETPQFLTDPERQ